MRKSEFLLFVALLVILSVQLSFGAIVTGSFNVSNYNQSGTYADFSINGENLTGGDIFIYGVGPYAFAGNNMTNLVPLGPIDIQKVLAMTNDSSLYADVVEIFSPADAHVGFFTQEGYYGVMSIVEVDEGDPISNFTVSYRINTQPSNLSLDDGSISGFCVDQPDQQSCFDAGKGCFYHFALDQCMEEQFDEEDHLGNPTCFIFDGQPDWCEKVNFCSYSGDLCDPPGAEEIPIQCGNITNSTLCGSISMLGNCCEWTGSSCTETQNNSCYAAAELPAGKQFCGDYAVLSNQTACDEIADFPYFLPCEWNNQSDLCEFGFDDFFSEGPGSFDEFDTQQSCESAGGVWKSESFQVTNPDGSTQTETETWCEMQFGFGSESCDTSCWACEYQSDGSDWADASAARTACENSNLDFCKFMPDANAFNGFGWCDFPQEFQGGAKDCDSDCGSCNFMNDPQTACGNSDADCRWVSLNTSQGEESWCESTTKTSCVNDCFQCFDQSSCENSPETCEWDSTFFYCKPEDFGSKEVCFDGIDNDGDDDVDCSDPDCSFDQFCGGYAYGFGGVHCADYDADAGYNMTYCESQETPFGNCTWVNTSQTGFEGICETPGEACFYFAESNDTCLGVDGCSWVNKTGCSINMSMELGCVQYDETDQGTCEANPGCIWDSEDSACDFVPFESCFNYNDQNTCNADSNCSWIEDEFGPGGFCDSICFGQEARENQTICTSSDYCIWQTGFCEGQFFGNNCFELDGNETGCLALGNGNLCSYQRDPSGPDSDGGGPEPAGFCNDKATAQMFEGQQGGEPIEIAFDAPDSNVPDSIDFVGLGLKDNKNSLAFGAPVVDTADAAFCANADTTKFFLFLDTDGDDDNSCDSKDSAHTGFEFYFTYKAEYDGEKIETKLSYRCLNETWVPTPIPISAWQKVMCNDIDGPMIAVEKESLRKFKRLFNESKDIRLYMISANETTNSSSPLDTVGPEFYTPGTADFKFECCNCPGQDIDGDGFTSEQDPDCKKFNQFGYIPFEGGPQCADSIDNDGNGFTDCADPGCVYDPYFCGGNFDAKANDTTTPKLIWHKVDRFPDFAMVKFDTNEPANGTVLFYNRTASCTGTPAVTLYDVGLQDSFSGNEYRPWHDVPFDEDTLGDPLEPNTTYTYKIKYCDSSSNCGLSACLNFTTKTTLNNFIFGFDLPENFTIDIPQLGISGDDFSYGKRANASVAKNLNVTLRCDSTGYAITLIGMNLLEAKDFNFTDAMTCGAVNATDNLMGMDTSNWQDVLQDTGVDYIKLFMPKNASTISHCDDNGENCQDVNSSVDCTYSGNETECTIPVSTGLGFSTYRLTGVVSGGESGGDEGGDEGGSGGGSSGGSSGGGSGAVVGLGPGSAAARTVSVGLISVGDTVSFNPNSDSIPVSLVQLKAKNNLAIMSLKFVSHDDQPDDVPAYENVYKYLEMTMVSGANADIDGFVTVTFRVPQSWVDEQTLGTDSVKLYKLVGGVWGELSTAYDAQAGEDYIFKAKTRGFSDFAIAGEPKPVEEVEEETADDSNISGNTVQEPQQQQPINTLEEQVESDSVDTRLKEGVAHSAGLGSTIALYALFVVIVVGTVGVLVYQRYPQLLQKPGRADGKGSSDSKGKKSDHKKSDKADHMTIDKNHPHLKQLRKYIKDAKKEGYSLHEIEQILEDAGWPKEIYKKELK